MNKFNNIKICSALKLYMINQPPRILIDNRGYEKRLYMTYKELSLKLGVPLGTCYGWIKTGKIARYYLEMLLKEGILKKEDLE